MGYHLIIKTEDNIVSHYAESYEDLAYFSDIDENSIIYQGEAHWTPSVVGTDHKYSSLAKEEFRAGIKAERLFRDQAITHGLMIEKLSQDVESFQAYVQNADSSIKRGDFLIRNAKNLEVEVKCFTFYKPKNAQACIYFSYEQYKKHQNMQAFTGAPIVIAFYQREGDKPLEDSLRMITIDTIQKENGKRVVYDKEKKTFIIPVDLAEEGFAYIDKIRGEIVVENTSSN